MLAVKSGDRRAFERIYARFKGPVFSMTRTWLRNDSIAEEITQETFLRVFRYRDRFEPTGSVSSWIFQIARNLSLDHLRKKKELLPSPADDHEAGILEQFADPKDLADAQLIERMDTQRVEQALSELSEQQREALALRTFSEWSYEEIAREMGLGLGALKSVLHRAKQELVRKLKEQG
jgi:RNA polymerase sigma-70 factor (ECF subfamily)